MKSPVLSKQRVARLEQQANALASERKWQDAVRLLSRVAQSAPADVSRWLQIADWQREARDFQASVQTLQQALEEQNQDAHQKSSTRLANDTSSTRDLERLWLALCETQAEAQNWAECVAACRSLLHLAPRHHLAREILATAHLHLEQLAETEAVLRELLLLSPRDPLHRLKLATLLQMQGKSGEALREFERVAESYPEAPFAGEALEAIELLDNLQMQQLLMRAGEQPMFHQQMQSALDETLRDNGFQLTDEGRESLRHMMSDGRLATEPERVRLH